MGRAPKVHPRCFGLHFEILRNDNTAAHPAEVEMSGLVLLNASNGYVVVHQVVPRYPQPDISMTLGRFCLADEHLPRPFLLSIRDVQPKASMFCPRPAIAQYICAQSSFTALHAAIQFELILISLHYSRTGSG